MQFTYQEEWLAGDRSPALSCSLPKRREPFRRRLCRPFFEGLLPEGAQRDAVARVLGISPDNEFGLLERLGGEVAGALTLWPEGDVPPRYETPDQPEALSDEDLIALLKSLPVRPFLAGAGGRLRLSLAGAQNYSLLYRAAAVEIAPLYDLLSTVAYPELDPGFAMRIGGRRTLEELRAGDWDRFASTAGLGAPFVRRRVRELAERALECADPVAAALALPGLSNEVLARCGVRAVQRAQRLAGTV